MHIHALDLKVIRDRLAAEVFVSEVERNLQLGDTDENATSPKSFRAVMKLI